MSDRTRTRVLTALKSSGPQTAAELAAKLDITTVSVRQHLEGLSDEGLAKYSDTKGTVGRPKRIWELTEPGHLEFPDNHSALALSLLNGAEEVFGPEGVDKLIAHREAQSEKVYLSVLAEAQSLSEKVTLLAKIRSQEGYMAEVSREGDDYLLIENHCSICAAATKNPGFCRSELSLFQHVLGQEAHVERTEHKISGDRRCAYRISLRS